MSDGGSWPLGGEGCPVVRTGRDSPTLLAQETGAVLDSSRRNGFNTGNSALTRFARRNSKSGATSGQLRFPSRGQSGAAVPTCCRCGCYSAHSRCLHVAPPRAGRADGDRGARQREHEHVSNVSPSTPNRRGIASTSLPNRRAPVGTAHQRNLNQVRNPRGQKSLEMQFRASTPHSTGENQEAHR